MKTPVEANANRFGAAIRGVSLAKGLDADKVAQIHTSWLHHQVIYFTDQSPGDDELKAFTLAFGPFGDKPYVKAVNGHADILEICRESDKSVVPDLLRTTGHPLK